LSGTLVGTAVVTFASLAGEPIPPPVAAVLIVMVTGYAFWPDVDHPSATVARYSFWPLSMMLSVTLNALAEVVFEATKTRHDEPRRDGHRLLTHTLAFALASGAGATAIATLWPRWGTFGVLFVGVSLALRGMAGDWAKKSGWLVTSGAAAGLSFLAIALAPAGVAPALLGVGVALGSFTHCLGDSCTLAGCPWLWPIPIKGQRWYPIGTPEFLRFRTGTREYDGEDWLRALMLAGIVALVLAHVPGFYPWIGDRVAALWA
jgi:hypothetical protein